MSSTPSGPTWLERPATAVVVALVSVAAATLIQQFVYPALSWNRDEPVYLWQAELLRSGLLTGADGGHPELLHPWLSGWSDGRFFTQYPVGWPLVILAGSLVAWPGAAIAVAALLAVTGVRALALELGFGPAVANASSIALLASPIFAVQGGVYLNYLFTLGLGLWFMSMFLSAVRTGIWWRAVVAGVAFGWIVVTRTFDAVLWGGVTVGYVAWLERGDWGRHLRTAAWFLAAVAPFVVVQALHNRVLTGSLLTLPISAKDPLDTFGFGDRRLMPSFEPEGYGPRRAVMSTLKHGFFLPWFFVGAYLGVLVAGLAVWLGRRRPQTWLLVALIAVFPIAYFPFWGTYVSSLTVRLSGPIYLVPLYAPMAILLAVGVVALARRRPSAAVALVVVMGLVAAPITVGRLGLNRELSRAQEVWRTSVEDLDEPSVVVVAATAYLMFLNPFSANDAEADGPIIYTTNAWPSVIDLLERHPDRLHYIQRSTRSPEELLPSEDPTRTEVVLSPLRIEGGAAVELVATIVPPHSGEEVWFLVDERGNLHWRQLTHDSTAGVPITATVLLATDAAPAAIRSRPDSLVLPTGELSVTVGVAFGSATRQARLTPLAMHRVHVRTGSGVEVLVPGVNLRGRDPDDRFPDRWDEVLETPWLQVDVRPVAG